MPPPPFLQHPLFTSVRVPVVNKKKEAPKILNKQKWIDRDPSMVLIPFPDSVTMVVARYQEDVQWTWIYGSHVVIYNKGESMVLPRDVKYESLPNVGREGHTFAHHLYENYHDLSEWTLFLQGNPWEHSPHLQDRLRQIDKLLPKQEGFLWLSESKVVCDLECLPHHTDMKHILPYLYMSLFKKEMVGVHGILFGGGAQFMVSRATVHQHPREFYGRLRSFLSYHVNPLEGFVIERMWGVIMDHDRHCIPPGRSVSIVLGDDEEDRKKEKEKTEKETWHVVTRIVDKKNWLSSSMVLEDVLNKEEMDIIVRRKIERPMQEIIALKFLAPRFEWLWLSSSSDPLVSMESIMTMVPPKSKKRALEILASPSFCIENTNMPIDGKRVGHFIQWLGVPHAHELHFVQTLPTDFRVLPMFHLYQALTTVPSR